MSDEIIAAIICAMATIIAALIQDSPQETKRRWLISIGVGLTCVALFFAVRGLYELYWEHQLPTRGTESSGKTETNASEVTPNAAVVRVTISEGCDVRDIIALLARNGIATEVELTDAAQNATFDYSFIDNNTHNLARLEGYLFPDTYDFFQPEQATSVLNKLLSNFERKLDNWEGELAYAETRGYSLNDIITIASLIERETDGTDQAQVASVIYNRLEGSGNRGGTYGLLQIDASLLYVLPDRTGLITSADLMTESPYNLYRNVGLPPTPIANPGAKAIHAALTPASTDYYYYSLAKDGKHRFFSSYAEFFSFLQSPDYIGN